MSTFSSYSHNETVVVFCPRCIRTMKPCAHLCIAGLIVHLRHCICSVESRHPFQSPNTTSIVSASILRCPPTIITLRTQLRTPLATEVHHGCHLSQISVQCRHRQWLSLRLPSIMLRERYGRVVRKGRSSFGRSCQVRNGRDLIEGQTG